MPRGRGPPKQTGHTVTSLTSGLACGKTYKGKPRTVLKLEEIHKKRCEICRKYNDPPSINSYEYCQGVPLNERQKLKKLKETYRYKLEQEKELKLNSNKVV